MPTKGTPPHTVRVDDETWNAAKEIAAERNENLSDIIRAALNQYIKQWGNK